MHPPNGLVDELQYRSYVSQRVLYNLTASRLIQVFGDETHVYERRLQAQQRALDVQEIMLMDAEATA